MENRESVHVFTLVPWCVVVYCRKIHINLSLSPSLLFCAAQDLPPRFVLHGLTNPPCPSNSLLHRITTVRVYGPLTWRIGMFLSICLSVFFVCSRPPSLFLLVLFLSFLQSCLINLTVHVSTLFSFSSSLVRVVSSCIADPRHSAPKKWKLPTLMPQGPFCQRAPSITHSSTKTVGFHFDPHVVRSCNSTFLFYFM